MRSSWLEFLPRDLVYKRFDKRVSKKLKAFKEEESAEADIVTAAYWLLQELEKEHLSGSFINGLGTMRRVLANLGFSNKVMDSKECKLWSEQAFEDFFKDGTIHFQVSNTEVFTGNDIIYLYKFAHAQNSASYLDGSQSIFSSSLYESERLLPFEAGSVRAHFEDLHLAFLLNLCRAAIFRTRATCQEPAGFREAIVGRMIKEFPSETRELLNREFPSGLFGAPNTASNACYRFAGFPVIFVAPAASVKVETDCLSLTDWLKRSYVKEFALAASKDADLLALPLEPLFSFPVMNWAETSVHQLPPGVSVQDFVETVMDLSELHTQNLLNSPEVQSAPSGPNLFGVLTDVQKITTVFSAVTSALALVA